jgi:hypothetical protein
MPLSRSTMMDVLEGIFDRLGRVEDSVARIERAGLQKKPNYHGNKGPSNGKARLTEDQVLEILFSPDSGASLARRFGVSSGAVNDIRKGRTWVHLRKQVDRLPSDRRQ